MGKCLLQTEMTAISEHLGSNQLAVGVQSGAEVMPHLARKWLELNVEDRDRVLVDTDKGNAHNEVDRHTFLRRAREVTPGACRWLEFIYPTHMATSIFYRGRVIDSHAGGQQGCPWMQVCHAFVERILQESLGIIPVDPLTTPIATVLDPPAQLDMAPMFADDSTWGGPSQEVHRSLVHLSNVLPQLGLRYSKLDIIPSAGVDSLIDVAAFMAIGCKVRLDKSVSVMKSPMGSDAFCEEHVSKRVREAILAVEAIADLPDKHCALHLLRYQTARLEYLVRTTPRKDCQSGLQVFDEAIRAAHERILGKSTSETDWRQLRLPTRFAGLGLRSALSTADAAYFASRTVTYDRCVNIYPGYGLSDSVEDECLTAAIQRINQVLGDADNRIQFPVADGETCPRQQQIMRNLYGAEAVDLHNIVGAWSSYYYLQP